MYSISVLIWYIWYQLILSSWQAQEAIEYRRAGSDPAKQIRTAQASDWASQFNRFWSTWWLRWANIRMATKYKPTKFYQDFFAMTRAYKWHFVWDTTSKNRVHVEVEAGTFRPMRHEMRCGRLLFEVGAASWRDMGGQGRDRKLTLHIYIYISFYLHIIIDNTWYNMIY